MSLTWKSLGTAEQHVGGQVQTKVLNYLKSVGEAGAFGPDISEQLGEKDDSVRKALNRLRAEKIIRKKGNAWLYPAGEDDELAI
jgi:Mn-dependent DtxR family transcriptional regulator